MKNLYIIFVAFVWLLSTNIQIYMSPSSPATSPCGNQTLESHGVDSSKNPIPRRHTPETSSLKPATSPCGNQTLESHGVDSSKNPIPRRHTPETSSLKPATSPCGNQTLESHGMESSKEESHEEKSGTKATMMFWNLENYFDPFNDELTDDEDFSYGGKYHWSWKKFIRKRNSIAKTIISISQQYGDFPIIIGFAEVENRFVLNQLLKETPLYRLNYSIVHRDSPDKRGIDVAMLYRKDRFRVLTVEAIPVTIPETTTRDILYVKGILLSPDGTLSVSGKLTSTGTLPVSGKLTSTGSPSASDQLTSTGTLPVSGKLTSTGSPSASDQLTSTGSPSTSEKYSTSDTLSISENNPHQSQSHSHKSQSHPETGATHFMQSGDTLHIFVNHWPSKISGTEASSGKRMSASNTLKMKIDSIAKADRIICSDNHIFGKVADYQTIPASRQGIIVMGDFNDTPDGEALQNVPLNNLAVEIAENGEGSIRYRGIWELIDQFLVSENMRPYCNMDIYKNEYITEKDKTYLGFKPFRTHIGPRYNGGVSDHLPIILQVKYW